MIEELKIDYTINEKHFKPDSIHLKYEVASVQTLLKEIFPAVKNNSFTQELVVSNRHYSYCHHWVW